MKKLVLSGLRATATEADVGAWLSRFGPVGAVRLVRDGDRQAQVAVIEMDISDAEAFHLTSRISRYWHDGSPVSARLLIR
ncbi:MAG TPA: RNA-binding protein [Rhodocyclaceae bacterium]|nr:RNA-binding protein [Rhodocyclaceae bacterium]